MDVSWQYKSSDVGKHTLTITCGKTVKTLYATIEKLDIDIEPITAGLAFDFNPSGRSNNDVNRLWSNGTVSMSVSDNFDWVNGGYQIDDNGDQYFCVKAGTTATIDYKLFEDDAKRTGKEFKLVFKTTNVRNANATFLNCLDGNDTSKIGIQMNVHEAYIHASADNLYLPYSEEDIIEFEFNISKNTDDIKMLMGYEDGVPTRPLIYGEGHSFSQINPQVITIGSLDCDVFIYRFKVYSSGLTDRGILNNFIADARNAEEMINRYTRNQIYDENSSLTPEILAEKCPDLRIIKIDAPWFTNDKKDKVTGTTIQHIYKNGDPVLDNWIAHNCRHNGQGTSSNEYGAAGRNLELDIKSSGIEGVTPYIVLGDGVTQTDKVSLTRDSVPNNYWNVKVNIASSENENNALLQRRYNEYNPYVRPAKKNNPSYAIHESKEFLQELLEDIIEIANELGITVNTRKTRICKLSEHWRFLQVQYSLTDTGRVIQKINPKRLTAMRRKMKKLAPKLTEKEFTDFYKSWFKNHYKIMSKKQRSNMDTLFNQLKEVTKCTQSPSPMAKS